MESANLHTNTIFDSTSPRTEQQGTAQSLHLTIQPARVAKLLTLIVLTLSVTGTIANVVIYQVAPHPEHKLARLFQRFDLGHEPSLAALYSSIALLASSSLLLLIGYAHRRSGKDKAWDWIGLAFVFLLLAIDEAVMFHEMLHNVLSERFDAHGIFFFPWVVPGIIFVGCVALSSLRLLFRLDARTRGLFITSGAIFVGGAIGMEMVAGVLVENHGVESIYHTIAQTIEETMEMLGIVLFIYALLDYIARHFQVVQVRAAHR